MEKNKSISNETLENIELTAGITEEEVIGVWRSIRSNHVLSETEAWHAIAAGIALDMAFAKPRPKNFKETAH